MVQNAPNTLFGSRPHIDKSCQGDDNYQFIYHIIKFICHLTHQCYFSP